jgi:hypothetical protein
MQQEMELGNEFQLLPEVRVLSTKHEMSESRCEPARREKTKDFILTCERQLILEDDNPSLWG